jgi:NADH:ubiquinone oxidoreductase subunit K
VVPGTLLDDLSPHARVATAVLPVLLAVGARIVLGKNRVTNWLISGALLWFAVNLWMVLFSAGMRQDVRNITGY